MKQKDFDPKACIRYLLDKTLDIGVREDAGDSLLWHPFPETVKAMISVVCDKSEDSDLRESIAECLGSLWSEMDYEEADLMKVPEPYRSALLKELELNKKNTEQGHFTRTGR